MAYLSDYILDNGLNALADGDVLYICSDEPTEYAECVSLALGNKPTPTISAPFDGDPGGRSVSISGFADGDTTGTGNAVWWALVDVSATRYLAGGPIDPEEAVVEAIDFTMDDITINIPDAE